MTVVVVRTRTRLTAWALALALASVYSATCLAGSLPRDPSQHDHCAGMTGGPQGSSVKTDCCAAGDLQAIPSSASSQVSQPPAVLIAAVGLTQPLLTARIESPRAKALSRPTYLVVSSFRI